MGPQTIRRAHAVHPIAAVQSEYFIWERDVEKSVLPTLRELGIGLVAYSPLGRGFLRGKIQDANDLDAADWRQAKFPRIQKENIEHNFKLVKKITAIAATDGITPGQVALAWLLRQDDYIVPISGTKHVKYLEENVQAVNLVLPEAEWLALDNFLVSFVPACSRYLADNMKLIDSE